MSLQLAEYRKTTPTVFEKAEGDARLVRLLISTDSVDRDNEVIDQETAFEKIEQWVKDGGTPITWMHDPGGSLGHAFEAQAMTRRGDAFVPRMSTDQPINAVQLSVEIAKDYGFGTMFWGRVETNDVWSMLLQKAINKSSAAFAGYDGGETESGAALVKVADYRESAIVTVPAQREARAVVERMLKFFGVQDSCKDCKAKADSRLKRLDNLDDAQWRWVVEHAKEHEPDHVDDLTVLAREFRDGFARLGS